MTGWLNWGLSLVIVVSLIGVLLLRWAHRDAQRAALAIRGYVKGLVSLNGVAAVIALGLTAVQLLHPAAVLAQGAATAAASDSTAATGAGLATGLACIGAGIAVGIAGAAAIGGITEKPEILGRTLIFVGLGEGIAIYGLIISFLILNR